MFHVELRRNQNAVKMTKSYIIMLIGSAIALLSMIIVLVGFEKAMIGVYLGAIIWVIGTIVETTEK